MMSVICEQNIVRVRFTGIFGSFLVGKAFAQKSRLLFSEFRVKVVRHRERIIFEWPLWKDPKDWNVGFQYSVPQITRAQRTMV
jgi:hypothetical protein